MVQWDEAQPEEGEKVEGYRLNYTALPDGERQTLKTVEASNNTELTLEGLKEFTEYNICVLAFNAQGNGPMSCKIERTAKDGTGFFFFCCKCKCVCSMIVFQRCLLIIYAS